MEEIKRFMEKVQTDEALKADMKELAQRKASLDEVIALAEGHGFSFTKEDWEAAAKEAAPAGELSEEQLAAVSGGGVILWIVESVITATFICLISASDRSKRDNCCLDEPDFYE